MGAQEGIKRRTIAALAVGGGEETGKDALWVGPLFRGGRVHRVGRSGPGRVRRAEVSHTPGPGAGVGGV